MLKLCILAAMAVLVVSVPKNPFRLYTGQSHFTILMLDTLMRDHPRSNIFFASHSAYRGLLHTYLGSSGETEEALKDLLFLSWAKDKAEVARTYKTEKISQRIRTWARVDKAVRFNSTDKLYFDDSFELRPNVTELYEDDIEKIDFSEPDAAREKINAFIKHDTTIKNFLPNNAVDANTNGVFVNNVYFKSNWENAFNKSDTLKLDVANGLSSMSMMRVQGEFNCGVLQSPEWEMAIIEVPFHGNVVNNSEKAISMMIYVPLRGNSSILLQLLPLLIQGSLRVEMQPVQLDIAFPKIKMQNEYHLKDVLKSLGVKDVFKKENMGDFGDDMTFVNILSKAAIRFDEDGATIAASTVDAAYGPEKKPKLSRKKDGVVLPSEQPFVFTINDRFFNEVLFAGIYRGPE